MINSDKVCSVTVTYLQIGGMGRTLISRGTANRENLSYPVRRNKWGETEHCTGNSCNLGNGQFGPDNGIAPVAPPNENHHCLCESSTIYWFCLSPVLASLTLEGPINFFQLVSMMTSLAMPDPETGAAGRIHIPVECWNAQEPMNVQPLLMLNNSMKMEKNLTLFTVYPEAVKVRQIFERNVL